MSWSWLLATDNMSVKQKCHLEFILNSWECKFTWCLKLAHQIMYTQQYLLQEPSTLRQTNPSCPASFAKLLPCANAKVKSTEALGGQSSTVCLSHTPRKNVQKYGKTLERTWAFTKFYQDFFLFFFLIDTFSQGIPRRMGISPGWRSSGSSH